MLRIRCTQDSISFFKCSGLCENQFLDETAVEELLSALATCAPQLFDHHRAPRILEMTACQPGIAFLARKCHLQWIGMPLQPAQDR
jgi:hypothetical protein